MTGIYVRVKRDGRWQNLELDTLTDAELEAWVHMQRAPGVGWLCGRALATWIRDYLAKVSVDK